jgi:hypothetical protein
MTAPLPPKCVLMITKITCMGPTGSKMIHVNNHHEQQILLIRLQHRCFAHARWYHIGYTSKTNVEIS